MSNPGLDVKMLPVEDFSGGMTDYYLLGDPKRYHKADNFLITVDKKLELRPGSNGFDSTNYKLPTSPERISGYVKVNSETELLVHQARKLFYLNPNWTEIVGPSGGGEAVGGGDAYSHLSWSPSSDHTYYTSSGGGLPGKLYKDSTGQYLAVTVGLPAPKSIPRYSDATLLNACITLANDLRASFVGHINDVVLHTRIDKYSLAFFTAQTWFESDTENPGLIPAPTPAPAASDEASLFALVRALNLAYEHHGRDLDTEYYHLQNRITLLGSATYTPPKGPFKLLSDNSLPTTMAQAATQLDTLRQRWYWHRLGVFGHSASNNYAVMNTHTVSAPAIGTIDTAGIPEIEPNYDDLFRYVNYLKYAYNTHVSNDNIDGVYSSGNKVWHTQQQNSQQPTLCTLPDAADLDSAFLIIYHIWAMYGNIHIGDAGVTSVTSFLADVAVGSKTLSNVTDLAAVPIGLLDNKWVTQASGTDVFWDPVKGNKNYLTSQILTGSLGSGAMDKSGFITSSAVHFVYSDSVYHSYYSSGATTSSTSHVTDDEKLDPLPTSGLSAINENLPATTEAWITLAQTVLQALSYHVGNDAVHQQGTSIANFLTPNARVTGPFYKPQISSYGYAFVLKHTYTVERGIEYQVEGPPVFVGTIETSKQHPVAANLDTGFSADDDNMVDFSNNVVAEIASTTIFNLPNLVNTSLTNYDLANIEVEIYRTQDGGNTYYLLDTVALGATSFTDNVSDTETAAGVAALSDRESLYTTGGEVNHEPPSSARYMHVLQGIAFYGYIEDTGQTFPNRVLQSIPGKLDAVPPDFSDDLEDEIVGISSTRSNIIILCRTSVYRMGGGFNNLGQGNLTHERIADKVGCISAASIVQTEIGIFFAGTDGFYYTDGFQMIKISIDLDITYAQHTQSAVQQSRIAGAYDTKNRRIWWTAQSEESAADCDKCFIYYLNYGVKPSGAFTTASNGNDWSPSAITFFEKELIRGDARGFIFRHKSIYKSDPQIPSDLTTALANWQRVHIPYFYQSCGIDFGTLAKGSYVTKIHFVGANEGNCDVQVNTIADNNYLAPSKKPLAPILYRENPRWGDATINWGQVDYNWTYSKKIDKWRRFPSQSLRAQLKQIEIAPAFVGVYNYDAFPEGAYVDVVGATKVVSLLTPATNTAIVWPSDVVGMYLAVESDEYEAEYEISVVSGADITVLDPDSTLVDASNLKWVIRGYMKETGLSMLGYVLHFAYLGERGSPYSAGAERGENG